MNWPELDFPLREIQFVNVRKNVLITNQKLLLGRKSPAMTAIKQQWRNGGQKLASALKREQTKKLASCFGKAIGKKE